MAVRAVMAVSIVWRRCDYGPEPAWKGPDDLTGVSLNYLEGFAVQVALETQAVALNFICRHAGVQLPMMTIVYLNKTLTCGICGRRQARSANGLETDFGLLRRQYRWTPL